MQNCVALFSLLFYKTKFYRVIKSKNGIQSSKSISITMKLPFFHLRGKNSSKLVSFQLYCQNTCKCHNIKSHSLPPPIPKSKFSISKTLKTRLLPLRNCHVNSVQNCHYTTSAYGSFVVDRNPLCTVLFYWKYLYRKVVQCIYNALQPSSWKYYVLHLNSWWEQVEKTTEDFYITE